MNKKIYLVLIIILFVIIIFKIFQAITPKPPTVTSSFPIQLSQNIDVNSSITINFDKKLNTLPQITTTPPFSFSPSLTSNNQTLNITPNADLLLDTSYQISLSSPNITPFTLYFKTKTSHILSPPPTPESQITASSIQLLISKLPVVTDKYIIQYFQKTKKFSINILENPYEENKKLAEDWFKEQGIENLSKLNIFYSTPRGVAP